MKEVAVIAVDLDTESQIVLNSKLYRTNKLQILAEEIILQTPVPITESLIYFVNTILVKKTL